MKELIGCQILPSVKTIALTAQNNGESYTLRGSIRVVLNKAVKIQTADLLLLSESKIMVESDKDMGKDKVKKDVAFTNYTHTNIIAECNVRGKTTLNFGVNDLEWELTLPTKNLYGSVECKYGYVRYKVISNIMQSGLFGAPFSSEVAIKVERPHPLPANIKPNSVATFRGKRDGKVAYEFEVPKVVGSEQSAIEIMMKLTPMTKDGWVRLVTIDLEEVTQYK
ncbi:hypothetical protein BC937DRAFT_94184 [Endogone sp. FLAS-F59071]|nr:hypothetical protein BC937DRAFT_94184 [Endogone sp. FLAS-F59071]|eukprot:RUS20861.1 hypothetical protein BC937DRAFT_94184 [Endogone sp. FLAS-F59071]